MLVTFSITYLFLLQINIFSFPLFLRTKNLCVIPKKNNHQNFFLIMKKLLSFFIGIIFSSIGFSQFTYKIKADSLLVTNDSCNTELNLENGTSNVLGFLYNKGNGRTEFRKGLIKLYDSLYIIGSDTLDIAKGMSAVPISKLVPATGSNTINNNSYLQEWQWNNLAAGSGLKLSSNSTAASTNLQRLLDVKLYGANAVSGETTVAGYFSNTHTGSTSTNVALEAIASGGTTNYAGRFTGGVLVNGTTTSTILKLPGGYTMSESGTTTTIHSNGFSTVYNLGSNGAPTFKTTNGVFKIERSIAPISSQTFALRNTAAGTKSDLSIGNFNDRVFVNQGTVKGNYIGTIIFVTTGGVTLPGNNSYGIAWMFDNQLAADNPNALWLYDNNGTVPFLIKKNGNILMGSSTDAGTYKLQVTGNTYMSGKQSIGTTSNTALLHLAAGSTTANTAPLKFTSGTNLTTPENGAVEYDGTNYFVTSGNTRYALAKTLTAAATLDFSSTAAQNSSNLTVTITGAADGDAVSLGVPNAAVNDNSSYSAWVSAANTVTVRFTNNSSGAIDPASGTFRVSVMKY
jgi:hypothetical protein